MGDDFENDKLTKLLPRLIRIAKHRGISDEDCPDIAQETIAGALEQIQRGNFRGDSKLETYVLAILNRRIADYWREKSKGNRLISLEKDNEASLEVTSHALPTTGHLDPHVRISFSEALQQLQSRKRAILLMKIQGNTIEEIATKLGMRPGTVRRELAKAIQEFSAALGNKPLRDVYIKGKSS